MIYYALQGVNGKAQCLFPIDHTPRFLLNHIRKGKKGYFVKCTIVLIHDGQKKCMASEIDEIRSTSLL